MMIQQPWAPYELGLYAFTSLRHAIADGILQMAPHWG